MRASSHSPRGLLPRLQLPRLAGSVGSGADVSSHARAAVEGALALGYADFEGAPTRDATQT